MTPNQLRSALYALAKLLGDVQALTHPKPHQAIPKRIARRLVGKATGRLMGKLLPPSR